MNIIKNTLAAASVIVCCMGNEMPAKAYNLHCMNLGMNMSTCSDSNGNNGTYTNIGGFETFDLNTNGQHVTCTRMIVGNSVITDCY